MQISKREKGPQSVQIQTDQSNFFKLCFVETNKTSAQLWKYKSNMNRFDANEIPRIKIPVHCYLAMQ